MQRYNINKITIKWQFKAQNKSIVISRIFIKIIFLDLPMVLIISNSSISYRGGSSCDPSSSDVVSLDIVYGLLQDCQRKFLIYFSCVPRHVERRKEARFNDPHCDILRPRTDDDSLSYLLFVTSQRDSSCSFVISLCNGSKSKQIKIIRYFSRFRKHKRLL